MITIMTKLTTKIEHSNDKHNYEDDGSIDNAAEDYHNNDIL